MISSKLLPELSPARVGRGFSVADFDTPVTAESVGVYWSRQQKKTISHAKPFFAVCASMLQASVAQAFTCASISGQTITITSTASLTCAAGEVAFLEIADVSNWQIMLANAVLNSAPFDYVLAGAFWAFAFSFTVGIWFLTKNIGLILAAIKKW